jgi:hypothetical protein
MYGAVQETLFTEDGDEREVDIDDTDGKKIE